MERVQSEESPRQRLERYVREIRNWVVRAYVFGILAYLVWAVGTAAVGWRDALVLIGAGLLLAAAAVAFGAAFGFLFGTPRTLQEGMTLHQGEPRQLVNTALEDVSAWLTKIIVGLGLINIDAIGVSFAKMLDSVSAPEPTLRPILAPLILFNCLLGFVGMYLLTRAYLSPALDLSARQALGDDGPEQEPLAAVGCCGRADCRQETALKGAATDPATAGCAGAPLI